MLFIHIAFNLRSRKDLKGQLVRLWGSDKEMRGSDVPKITWEISNKIGTKIEPVILGLGDFPLYSLALQ